MKLNDILILKYPQADFKKDILIQDDGQGAYIKEWNLSDSKPTQIDLDRWASEIESQWTAHQNKLANAPLYKELDSIDMKSIRALRTKDTARLSELEQQAQAIRAKLK